ncbi:hypothetical protein [Enterobacter cancerogenus]|uniref:hypothetical protein n=1 Tax=Enterobacter cancerogenus TaxID=69218 RepID=UPI000734D822|nr:hypothetical protein [Enterobacter cancerogenus]KTQ49421.1 hypothetical protein NS104_04925 [Enterobacter cancerogenus]KTQ51914.1 hypothetical protein NS111_12695 [Enterobacter cancerogenus]KTQ73388.1 hypothetical protein NS188_13265 [Enterobacter cancerogenus]KTQ79887.1 hypothetical protein NS31R_14420 [Enterobacter cancerogenus]
MINQLAVDRVGDIAYRAIRLKPPGLFFTVGELSHIQAANFGCTASWAVIRTTLNHADPYIAVVSFTAFISAIRADGQVWFVDISIVRAELVISDSGAHNHLRA